MNFSQTYDNTVRTLEIKLGDLVDSGSEFDFERKGDVLDIEFEDGEKIVITPQSPLEQLWVSANYGGHRFNWSGDAWLNEKDGEDLHSFLSALMSRKLNDTIQV